MWRWFAKIGVCDDILFVIRRMDGYSTDDISYTWHKNSDTAVTVDKNLTLPQFDISKITRKKFGRTVQELSTGAYSRLWVRFNFHRNIGFYMLQIFLPSILIVVISWVSFWLSRDAAPARVSLGVTTVLTMTTLMTTTNSAMPKVSYVKAIDIYMMTSFVMVFASLLEYAAVGYLNKRMIMKKEKKLRKDPVLPIEIPITLPMVPRNQALQEPFSGISSPMSSTATHQTLECDCDIATFRPLKPIKMPKSRRRRNRGITPSQIDKYSRVVFPVIFASFNDGFTESDIKLEWAAGNKSVGIDVDKTNLPTFELGQIIINETSAELSTGNYSRLRLTMMFARNFGFYFIQVYLPAVLVVIISWVSFWINRDSAPARTILGITTVLTITALITSTNTEMPHVSYVKAVDIYLGMCYFFVFMALLEYAAVNYSSKKQRDRRNRRKRLLKLSLPAFQQRPDIIQSVQESQPLLSPPCTCPSSPTYSTMHTGVPMEPPTIQGSAGDVLEPRESRCKGFILDPTLIDKYCRFGFPTAFAIFNAVYWLTFMKTGGKRLA